MTDYPVCHKYASPEANEFMFIWDEYVRGFPVLCGVTTIVVKTTAQIFKKIERRFGYNKSHELLKRRNNVR